MKNTFYLLILCASISIGAQNLPVIKTESGKVYSIFFDDGILAKRTWVGADKKRDSIKTFYKSGKLNEIFNCDESGRYLKGKKYNPKSELITSWSFKKGKVLRRIDHKKEYNSKNKTKTLQAYSIIEKCNEELLKNPNNTKFKYLRARQRAFLGNYILALQDFLIFRKSIERIKSKKPLKIDDKFLASIYDYLASIYSSYEMENQTIHYKLKAIETSPKQGRLLYNLGSYLVMKGNYNLGIAYLNKVVKRNPNHNFANWVLGIAHSDLGDYKTALTHLNIAFKTEDGIYKRNSGKAERDLRTTRGLIYHYLGESDKGIIDLEEALELNKNNTFALRNLGIIYNDLNKFSKSCEFLSKAKELGYEKVHDRNDLQEYLENACSKKVSEFKQIKTAQKPSIYPNPTKDIIRIKNFDFDNFEYRIYNFESNLIKKGISNKKSIDFSGFENGLYVLILKVETKSFTFKVIKE